MFAKCGRLLDAQVIFNGMAYYNLVCWTTLMLAYAENREERLALEILARMEHEEGCAPNSRAFVAAAKACSNIAVAEEGMLVGGRIVKVGALDSAMAVHSRAIKHGCDLDIFVANSLLDMYVKCGNLVDARMVFDRMVCRSVVSWTALVLGYVDNDEEEVGLDLISCMSSSCERCEPNAWTLVAGMKGCASLANKEEGQEVEGRLMKAESLEKGMRLHSQAIKLGFEGDMYVANTLLDMYAKCGSMVTAQRIFNKMSRHTAVSWNALMLGYARSGNPEVTLELFENTGEEANAWTFATAFKACLGLATKETGTSIDGRIIKVASLDRGMAIHSRARMLRYDLDLCVGNALVDMYSECGSMSDASRAFNRMPARDLLSWDLLMLGYTQNEQPDVTLEVFSRMQQQGLLPGCRSFVAALKAWTSLASKKIAGGELDKADCLYRGAALHSQATQAGLVSDEFVASTLVDMYCKCGNLSLAREVFETMTYRDAVPWNALILGYAENDEGEAALELFARMELQGCAPDALSFVAALKACGSLAALDRAKLVHGVINKLGFFERTEIANGLLDVYAKCGSMVDADCVFFSSATTKNLVAWNTVIAGYSRQGNAKRVVELLHGVLDEGLCPSAVTFVCLLSACSRGGLVDKARYFFHSMLSRFGTSPGIKHYHCFADSLGRANRLDEAVELVEKMPFMPNSVTWSTVLSASRILSDEEVGKRAFESWLRVEDGDNPAAAYVLLANLYESSKR